MAIFGKNRGLTPLENFDFLEFLKSCLFLSKKHSSLSRISKKQPFLAGFAEKLQMRKMVIFCQKPWINPFGKFSMFWTY